MSGRRLAWITAAFALGACTWTSTRPAAPQPATEPQNATPAPEPTAPPPAPTPSVEQLHTDPLALATVRIEQVVGVSPATAGALLAEVPEQLEQECHARTPGMVQVRVTAQGGEVASTLRTSSRHATIDACVLRVLAQNIDDALEPSTSPAEHTAPIESVVTVSW